MVGIYKITNPNNKVYIGQSINIERRFLTYKKYNCQSQIKLYNSLNKYGFDNHIFEIIEECNDEELNTKERYYQEKYDAIEKGLNCIYTKTNDKSGRISETEKQNRRFKRQIELLTFSAEEENNINNINRNLIELLEDDDDLKYLNEEYSIHYIPDGKKSFIEKEKLFQKFNKEFHYILLYNDIILDIYSEVFCVKNSFFKCKLGIFEVININKYDFTIMITAERIAEYKNNEGFFFDLTKGEIQPIC